jgi:NitT/TauT family transport system substrate-binding protein
MTAELSTETPSQEGRRSSSFLCAATHVADPLRLGLLHTLSPAPFYIAHERGYFSDEEIDLSFRFFEAAQPIAAAVSGAIDVGVTAPAGA